MVSGPDNPAATKFSEEYNGGKVMCECFGPDKKANAALIVKAANAHDELLDLATGLIALVESFAPDMPYHNGLIDAAKARLAQVQQ